MDVSVSELNSPNVLMETFASDISFSDDSENGLCHQEEGAHTNYRYNAFNQILDKKRKEYDMELLAIELSEKNMMIKQSEADHIIKVDDLEEKLDEAKYKIKILTAKLDYCSSYQNEDFKNRNVIMQTQLDNVLTRQKELECVNKKLQEKSVSVLRSCVDLDITDEEYSQINLKSFEALSFRDHFAMRFYETSKPLNNEIKMLKESVTSLQSQNSEANQNLERLSTALIDEKMTSQELSNENKSLTASLSDVKSQVLRDNYKIENFDVVKSERDVFEQQIIELKQRTAYLDASQSTLLQEQNDNLAQWKSEKQANNILRQDKDYFSKKVSDLENKLLYSEQTLKDYMDQLKRTEKTREDLYEKYISSRDQFKKEYETKLHEELEHVRKQTNMELEKLKTSSREMYERENRSFRESRDMAISERDRAVTTEKEANLKYENLMHELRNLQVTTDCKMSEVSSGAKIKHFEAERTQMIYEETLHNLKLCQSENEKLSKKLEVATKEYYTLENNLQRRISELEGISNEKNIKLESYEKLEEELDQVILQAAETNEELDAEKVLFTYGYGANVPTTAKRRLKQSVHLARRVLNLERTNGELENNINKYKDRIGELQSQMESSDDLLRNVDQPYQYLVDNIKNKDEQLKSQKTHLREMEEELKNLHKEHGELKQSKNAMASDLEKLLRQKEELGEIKSTIEKIQKQRHKKPIPSSKKVISVPSSKKVISVPSSKNVISEEKSKPLSNEDDLLNTRNKLIILKH